MSLEVLSLKGKHNAVKSAWYFAATNIPCGGEEAVPRAASGFMQNQSRAIYEIPAATVALPP